MPLLTSQSEIEAALQKIHKDTTDKQPTFNITCTKKWDGDAALLELHYPGFVQEYTVDSVITYKQEEYTWFIELPRQKSRRIHPGTFVYTQLKPEAKKILAKIDQTKKDKYYHIFAFRVEVLVNQCGPYRARNFLTALTKDIFLRRKDNEDNLSTKVQEARRKEKEALDAFNANYKTQYVHFVILDETTHQYTLKERQWHKEELLKMVNEKVLPKKPRGEIAYWVLSENGGFEMRLGSATNWGDGFKATYAQRMTKLHRIFQTRDYYQVSDLTYKILFVTPLIHVQEHDSPTNEIAHHNLQQQYRNVVRFLEAKNAKTAVEGCVLTIEYGENMLMRYKVKRRTVWAMPSQILVWNMTEVVNNMNWKGHIDMLLPADEILFICFGNAWLEREISIRKNVEKKRPHATTVDPPIGWDLQIAKQYDEKKHKNDLELEKTFGTLAVTEMAKNGGPKVKNLDALRLGKMAGLQFVPLSKITQISQHHVDCNLVRFLGSEGCKKAQRLFASFTHQNVVTSHLEHGPPLLHRIDPDSVEYTSPMPRDDEKISESYDRTKFIHVRNLPCYVDKFTYYTNLGYASTNPFWGDFFRLQFIFRYLLQYPQKTKQWWPFLSLPMKQWVLNHVRNSRIYKTQYDPIHKPEIWVPAYTDTTARLFPNISARFKHYLTLEKLPEKKIDTLWFAQNQLPSPSQSMFHCILTKLHPVGGPTASKTPEDMWTDVWEIILKHNENWNGDPKNKIRDRIKNVFKFEFIHNYNTFKGNIQKDFHDYDNLLKVFAVSRHPVFYAEYDGRPETFEKRLHALQCNFMPHTQHQYQNYLQYVTETHFDEYFRL